jgi:uncharacterized protein
VLQHVRSPGRLSLPWSVMTERRVTRSTRLPRSSIRSREDIAAFLEGQQYIMALLRDVAALGIDDCWIGAGLIRNAVWDRLHGYRIEPVARSDVDVVYCDPLDASRERDLAIEARLCEERPGVPWSVHNQARMCGRNGNMEYRNTQDAIRHWPETATAIAARLFDDRVDVIAPHGVDDLVGLVVRPSPAFMDRLPAYRSRVASKTGRRDGRDFVSSTPEVTERTAPARIEAHMRNFAWACFQCRAAVRRPANATDVRCPSCGESCACMGEEIPIPPKSKSKEWAALENAYLRWKAGRGGSRTS